MDFNHPMVNEADHPISVVPKMPVGPVQSCLDQKK